MTQYISPTFQINDADGKPIVGAKKYLFEPGTSTLKTIYSDAELTLPIENPVESNEFGEFPDIYLDGLYREVQHDNEGVQRWDSDVGSLEGGQAQLWSVSETYNIPDIVYASDDEYYRSLTDSNIGNNPTTSPAAWEVIKFIQVWNTNVTYVLNQHAYGSDGTLYFSRLASNFGNDPTSNPDDWGSVAGNVPIVTAGSATVYTATFGITAYETNRVYEARIHTDNTGAATINFDSLGAKNIKRLDGGNPIAGQLSGVIRLWDDGTNMVILDPALVTGTFNPTIQDVSASDGEGQTYASRAGDYTVIGNRLFFSGYVWLSSLGTLSGSLRLAGFPVTSQGTVTAGTLHIGNGELLSIGIGESITGQMTGGTTSFNLYLWDAITGTEEVTPADLTDDGRLQFSGSYII